jgi:hypothetical protein
MAWYKVGAVSIVNGQTSVTGIGTRFASNARVGDAFRGPDGEWYEVLNIASETTLGIFPAYAGPTVTNNLNYTIAPMQGYVKDSADKLRQVVQGLQDISEDVGQAQAAADAAKVSETNAASAAVSANDSKIAAGTSETNAKTSETNAAASNTSANASKIAAAASQVAAKASETAAKTSETNSGTSATTATTKAAEANTSAVNAKTSETNSKTSETNSKTSETNANASKVAAAASQTAAKTSETNAGTSATGAASSASAAQTARTQAGTSATNAAASELLASQWASNPVDTIVASGKYSALHWAQKAKDSADSVTAVTGPRLTSIAQAVLAVNDLLIADSATTMKSLSTGTVGRSLIGAETQAIARGFLGVGTAATADLTTTLTDTTANRVLRVGNFGLGNIAIAPTLTNINDTTLATGFYRISNYTPTTDLPANSGAYGVVRIERYSEGYYKQWYSTNANSGTNVGDEWYRSYRADTAVFTPWKKTATGDEITAALTAVGLGVIVVPQVTAADSVTLSGEYYVLNTATGIPIAASGVLKHQSWGNSSAARQVYSSLSAPVRKFTRTKSSGVWLAWVEDWNSSNLVLTTTQTDSTAGRILKVGDWGLGALIAPNAPDANTITQSGFYGVNGGIGAPANYPIAGAVNGMLTHNSWNGSGGAGQTYMTTSNGNGRLFWRSQTSGAWNGWNEVPSLSYVDGRFTAAGFTGTTQLVDIADGDSFDLPNGLYAVGPGSTGAKPSGQTRGIIFVTAREWTSGRMAQTWYSTESTGTSSSWKRVNVGRSWSAWVKDATQIDIDLKANAASPQLTGTARIFGDNVLRFVNTTSTNGVIHRVDGTSYYILLTDTGSPEGSFNSLRPFSINFATGLVTANLINTTTPAVGDNTLRAPNTTWTNTAINNAKRYMAGNVVGISATPYVMTGVQTGYSFNCTLANAVITLPPTADAGIGGTVLIRNVSSGNVTVNTPGGSIFEQASTVASITLAANEWVEIQVSTTNYFVNSRGMLRAIPTILADYAPKVAPVITGGMTIAGTVGLTGLLNMSGQIRSQTYFDPIIVANATGAYAMNLTNASTFELTLTGNTTLSFTGIPTIPANTLMTVMVTIKQGTTAYTLTLPGSTTPITVGGAAISTPAASKQQDYIFTTKNGTAWEVRAGANT